MALSLSMAGLSLQNAPPVCEVAATEARIRSSLKAHPSTFPEELIVLVIQYLCPIQDVLRRDLELRGRCSALTLDYLDRMGEQLQRLDLSHIRLGQPNALCRNGESADIEHTDDNLVHTCLSLAQPEVLGQIFSRCRNLTELNLASCNINDACVATIPRYLPQLHLLDLSDNRAISFIGIQAVAKVQTLRQLHLRDMVRGPDDAQSNCCFFRLSMDETERAQTGGIALIQQLPALHTLDLSGNYLTGGADYLDTELPLDSCLPAIVEMMQKIETLQKVILKCCPELLATDIQRLREQRPRAAIEIISLDLRELSR